MEQDVKDEDIYYAQREELLALLKSRSSMHEPLIVHGRQVLTPDDIVAVLHKIRQGYGFSRKERSALTEAGFQVDKIYPKL